MSKCLIVTLLLSICVTTSPAQWVHSKGPYRGEVTSALEHGGMLFVGTERDGVFGSTDAGKTWSAFNSGLTDLHVLKIESAGPKLFASTASAVFVSFDNGANWQLSACPPFSAFISAGSVLFVLTRDGSPGNNISRSIDGGLTWAGVAISNLPFYIERVYLGHGNYENVTRYPNLISLAYVNSTFFVGTDAAGIYATTDAGMNWHTLNTGLPQKSDPHFFYAGVLSFAPLGANLLIGTDSGIFVSTDNGGAWSPSSDGLPILPVLSITSDEGTLLAVTKNEIYRSSDSGKGWTPTQRSLNGATGLMTFSSTAFVIANQNGYGGGRLYLSSDRGSTWDIMDAALTDSMSIRSFGSFGQITLVGTIGFGIFRSSDDGVHWQPSNIGVESNSIAALAESGTVLFAAADRPDAIYRSQDSGVSWDSLQGGPHGINSLFVSESDLYAGNASAYHSSDIGTTWARSSFPRAAIYGFEGSADNLFAASDAGVYRSINNATTWKAAGLSDKSVRKLLFFGSTLYAATSNGIFITTDYGRQWSAHGLDGTPVSDIVSYGSNLFAAKANTVYISIDSGYTWNDVGTPNLPASINKLAIMGANLVAASWSNGVWIRPLLEMVTSSEVSPLNRTPNIRLFQNFPNPVEQQTEIDFELPDRTYVTLVLYDAAGRAVMTIVDQTLDQGRHSIQLYTDHLSNGTYWYQLTAGGQKATRALLVLQQ